jgi:hypothetical protein
MNQDKFNKIKGRWVHAAPYDSDDYWAIYEVLGTADNPIVKAHDTQDGENFEITNITWDGEVLKFESLMPSTGRRGVNKFRFLEDGMIESEFTFTVIEKMKKEKT